MPPRLEGPAHGDTNRVPARWAARRAMRVPTGTLAILLLTAVLAGQELWYASYQQGVDAFKKSEYALAKRKLVEAITNRQAPRTRGRRVLYYGLLRDEFIPEYYLAIIASHDKQWNEAIRYADAAEIYMRGDKDYPNLTAAKLVAVNALGSATTTVPSSTVATTTIKPDPPSTTSVVPPPTTTVVGPSAIQRQSDALLAQASRAMANGAFADARGLAGQARALGVDIAAADAMLRRIVAAERTARNSETQGQITATLGQRNWSAAADLVDRLAREGGDPAFVTAARGAISRGLEQDAARGLERAAVTAFYKGNYQAALGTFARMPRSQITPRVLFYQACTNAALALVEGPAGAPRLTRARALYAQSDPQRNSFARHRRFVSPQIISALEQ